MRTLYLLLSFFTATATAGESEIVLKNGPARNLVVAHCAMCHSLDYITMHATILDQAGWEKTVVKMINVMGAPVKDTDKKTIVEYLAKNYGK
jgi:hypothetical protein